jgi:hypothetical protein
MARNKPKTAINREGDTPRVNRNIFALSWTKQEAERVPEEVSGIRTGKIIKTENILSVSGNSFVYLPQSVFDWFQIPPFAGTLPNSDETRRILVRSHTRTIVTSAIGATTEETREISVIPFERESGAGKGGKARKRIKVQLMGLVTAKGKPRYLTIPFPPFFNRHMISQALATMFAQTSDERKPINYTPTVSKASYRIPYGADSDGLMGDWLSGAWLTTSVLVTESNISNPGGEISGSNMGAYGSSGDADV